MESESIPAKRIKLKEDVEFTPPVEMMVNDFDDERTLDEEEALESQEDHQTELSDLQKEGDMPLEELLAMYGYKDEEGSTDSKSEVTSTKEEPQEKEAENDMASKAASADEATKQEEESDEEEEKPSELAKLYEDIPDSNASGRSLRLSRPQSEEEEEDYDYSPDEEEWKKTIMIGRTYQADVPEGLCKYDDALPYENEDKLLWDPQQLSNKELEEYLTKALEPLISSAQGIAMIPVGSHIKDDEQALYLLLQCGYNTEEALRRRRLNAVQPTDSMSLWSEEECKNFENGLRLYGKDFHQIQQNKVRTRSVGELVQFYYLWKKTERHDIFANKARLEKKKYALHPGVTDYMDRFLEDQDSGGATRDRSSSPNVVCVIYGDPKRLQRNSNLNDQISSSNLTVEADEKG